MKIDPVSILLNENFRIDKKIYFISGNEKTLMQKIKATIVGKYQKNTNAGLTNIAVSYTHLTLPTIYSV